MFVLNEKLVNKLDFVVLTHVCERLSSKYFQVVRFQCPEYRVTIFNSSLLQGKLPTFEELIYQEFKISTFFLGYNI